MAKRKRDDGDGAGDDAGTGAGAGAGAGDADAPNFRRQRQIMAAYVQGAQQLEKAFKLARGFERQKLGRRRKNALAEAKVKEAKGNADTMAKRSIEDEVARIDAEVAALKTLDTTRSAHNFLAKSLLKIKAVQVAPDLPADISSPKPVSSDSAMLNVHARLCNSNPVKAALPAAAAAVKSEFGLVPNGQDVYAAKRAGVHSADVTKDDGSESSDNDGGDDEVDHDTGDGSDVDIADLERQLEQEGVTRSRPGKNHEPTKLFLPTLTMAGYVSGSGSDLDDDDDVHNTKPAKNRRGQRARQAIWEKKYGKRAKHVQEQATKQGRDAKRGAASFSKFAKDANAAPLGKQRPELGLIKSVERSKRSRDDTGPLHPSWEAAKRAKEKKIEKIEFAGKKIVFD